MKMTSTTNLIVTILVFSISFSQSLIGTGADGPLWVPEGETYLVDEVRTIINGNNSSGLIQLDVNSSDGFEPGDEIWTSYKELDTQRSHAAFLFS